MSVKVQTEDCKSVTYRSLQVRSLLVASWQVCVCVCAPGLAGLAANPWTSLAFGADRKCGNNKWFAALAREGAPFLSKRGGFVGCCIHLLSPSLNTGLGCLWRFQGIEKYERIEKSRDFTFFKQFLFQVLVAPSFDFVKRGASLLTY